MKNQAIFSSQDKSKKLKCRLLQVLFGALRLITAEKGNITKKSVNSCMHFRHKFKKKKKKRKVISSKQIPHQIQIQY